MAGPTASVLLNMSLSDELISNIYAIIDSYSGDREKNDFYISGNLVSATNTKLWPFGVEIREITTDYYYSAKDLSEISTILNFEPKTDIVLMAMCNGIESHNILWLLCLKIAEASNGIVDFGGKLDTATQTIKGSLHSIPHETDNGYSTMTNIGDVEFLKYWLEHEDFRMIT